MIEIIWPFIGVRRGTRVTATFKDHLERDPPSKIAGLDIGERYETPVVAVADGYVVGAGWSKTGGWYVRLDHGHNIHSYYAHLQRINVVRHTEVQQGDIIGWVGNTGRSTGPHLHWSMLEKGQPVDPMEFFGGGK